MDQWYLAKDGQQEGPVTSHQIAARAKAGALNPTTTLVWREGFPDWKTLGESGILEQTEASLPAAPANPYLVTERTRTSLAETSAGSNGEYPGYGRLRYFLTHFVFTLVCYAIFAAVIFAAFSSESGVAIILGGVALFLGAFAGSIYISVQRLKNLGMSGWAILWGFVPFINIWLAWRMIACPAGYEHFRSLDTAGKVITGLWVGLVALGIAANIFVAVAQA